MHIVAISRLKSIRRDQESLEFDFNGCFLGYKIHKIYLKTLVCLDSFDLGEEYILFIKLSGCRSMVLYGTIEKFKKIDITGSYI